MPTRPDVTPVETKEVMFEVQSPLTELTSEITLGKKKQLEVILPAVRN